MSRAASILGRYTDLSEKGSKYKNPVESNGPGNPYHGPSGQFVSANKAVLASKHINMLKKTGNPMRIPLKGWKEKDGVNIMKPGGTGKMPAGPNVCGRTARKQGLDIRCHDGKVMGGHTKLKAAADKSRKARGK